MRSPCSYPRPKDAPPIVSKLKRGFREAFVRAMKMPAGMNKTNSVVFWLDPSGHLNSACLFPNTYPNAVEPKCPLIMRVAINHYAFDSRESTIRRMGWTHLVESADKQCHRWRFELSLLPGEVLDFVPWIASLAEAHAAGSHDLVGKPPHPCFVGGSDIFESHYAWTHAAWRANDLYRYPEQLRGGEIRWPYFASSEI